MNKKCLIDFNIPELKDYDKESKEIRVHFNIVLNYSINSNNI